MTLLPQRWLLAFRKTGLKCILNSSTLQKAHCLESLNWINRSQQGSCEVK
ncbi:Hypothetical predicted protein [Scomber scombrus]|uniref:Uncharacterized protein n=1 Tax=Scomber scombrus TaxID=13677 RepID=A0AAV1P901_SCOSC